MDHMANSHATKMKEFRSVEAGQAFARRVQDQINSAAVARRAEERAQRTIPHNKASAKAKAKATAPEAEAEAPDSQQTVCFFFVFLCFLVVRQCDFIHPSIHPSIHWCSHVLRVRMHQSIHTSIHHRASRLCCLSSKTSDQTGAVATPIRPPSSSASSQPISSSSQQADGSPGTNWASHFPEVKIRQQYHLADLPQAFPSHT